MDIGEVQMVCPLAWVNFMKTWISKKDTKLKYFLMQKRELLYLRITDRKELLALSILVTVLFGAYAFNNVLFHFLYKVSTVWSICDLLCFCYKVWFIHNLDWNSSFTCLCIFNKSECLFRITGLGEVEPNTLHFNRTLRPGKGKGLAHHYGGLAYNLACQRLRQNASALEISASSAKTVPLAVDILVFLH